MNKVVEKQIKQFNLKLIEEKFQKIFVLFEGWKKWKGNSSYSPFCSTNNYVLVLKPHLKKQIKEYNSDFSDYIEIITIVSQRSLSVIYFQIITNGKRKRTYLRLKYLDSTYERLLISNIKKVWYECWKKINYYPNYSCIQK